MQFGIFSVSDITTGLVFDVAAEPGTCAPSDNAEDAFFTFNVTSEADITISAEGTGGNHTLSLFDRDPRYPAKPQASGGSFASNIDTTAYAGRSAVQRRSITLPSQRSIVHGCARRGSSW